MPNYMFLVHFFLVGDHPWVIWRPSLVWWTTVLRMLGDNSWHLSLGVSFVSNVYVPNSNSVVHFLLVGDNPWVGG